MTEVRLPSEELNLVRTKTKFYIVNPRRKMMRKKSSLFQQSQPYHHATYHHTCKILKNPIFKILNKDISWVVKNSNIRWGLSSKDVFPNKTSTTFFAVVSCGQRS